MKTERVSKAGVPRRGTRVGDKKLPKLDVAGSNPVGRSNSPGGYGHGSVTPFNFLTFF